MSRNINFKLEKMSEKRKPVMIIDVVADLLPEHLNSKDEWTNREIEEFMEKYGDEIYYEFLKRKESSPLNINRERLFTCVSPFLKELYVLNDEILEKVKEYLAIYEIGIFADNFPDRITMLGVFYDSEKNLYIVDNIDERDYYETVYKLLCLRADEMQDLDSFIRAEVSEKFID